ncbi:MAG TPA: hypothetical protein VM736_00705 [Gemmatimonadales bacterium]|nr:hypothetical protein [Gemmatimonadales bacterium]
MTPRRRLVAVTAGVTGLALVAAACSNPSALPAATLASVVDTVSLYALRGTAITLPSAYSLQNTTAVRIDQTVALDFAFDYDSVGEPAFFSTGALHLGSASGLLRATGSFDAITLAPTTGYILDKPLALDTTTVLYVASRPLTCLFGLTVPLYAKVRVLRLDPVAKRVDFLILVDQNCGYRGLATGLPTQ